MLIMFILLLGGTICLSFLVGAMLMMVFILENCDMKKATTEDSKEVDDG